MLSRVRRLERGRAPALSPFESLYGSLEAFAADVWADVDAGLLDGRDMEVVLLAVTRWHEDGVWGRWRGTGALSVPVQGFGY
jgi:hypothetical protein